MTYHSLYLLGGQVGHQSGSVLNQVLGVPQQGVDCYLINNTLSASFLNWARHIMYFMTKEGHTEPTGFIGNTRYLSGDPDIGEGQAPARRLPLRDVEQPLP